MPAPASFSARALIADAYAEIGVASESYTLSGYDEALGFTRLNSLIDRWATNRLTIYQTVRSQFTLTSGTQTYTIGTGGTFNVARPLWIPYAGLVITSGSVAIENPIQVFTVQDWSNEAIKALTSAYPSGIYYDYAFSGGLGTITTWPVPTTGLALALYLPTALTLFADLTTAYSFPPGYYEALLYNLAMRLWPAFNGADPIPQDLKVNAKTALGDVKRSNERMTTQAADLALFQSNRRTLSRSAFLSGQV